MDHRPKSERSPSCSQDKQRPQSLRVNNKGHPEMGHLVVRLTKYKYHDKLSVKYKHLLSLSIYKRVSLLPMANSKVFPIVSFNLKLSSTLVSLELIKSLTRSGRKRKCKMVIQF